MLFFLDQHGCAKNQVDAEILIGILLENGWEKTDTPEDAALIIVNSCGFIDSAKKESIDAVITARTAYPSAKIILSGCLSERYAEDLVEGLSEADAFFGNGDLSAFPVLLKTLFPSSTQESQERQESQESQESQAPHMLHKAPVLKAPQKGVCSGSRPTSLSFARSTYVKITEGCNNCCSFCAIPLIRGSLRSRTIQEICSEISNLVHSGIYEINLIGQDLSAYGCGKGDIVSSAVPEGTGLCPDFTQSENTSPLSVLLSAISSLEGDFRVRLLYIHPDHFPRDILPIMTSDTRFYPYFDIPFQSGDEEILRAMNRSGSAQIYSNLISDIRSAFTKDKSPYGFAAIRTTILTGFPGETDESFETTARFLSSIRPLWSGAFRWSSEEGTVAASLKKKVTKKKAEARLLALQELQIRITPEELAAFVGKSVDVLVEEVLPLDASSVLEAETSFIPSSRLALARTWFQSPDVDGSVVLQFEDNQKDSRGEPIAAGSVVSALIMNVNGVDLEAVVR